MGAFRTGALVAMMAGAGGSVVLMLDFGRRTPILLLVGFIVWVLSPFAGLLWADRASNRWSAPARMTLYCVMLVVALISVAYYAELLLPPAGSAPAFVFVVVPLVLWVLVAAVVATAELRSRARSRRG